MFSLCFLSLGKENNCFFPKQRDAWGSHTLLKGSDALAEFRNGMHGHFSPKRTLNQWIFRWFSCVFREVYIYICFFFVVKMLVENLENATQTQYTTMIVTA